MSMPRKQKPASFTRNGHEYLFGVLAHTRRRLEIFRNAGGEATWFDESHPAMVEEIQPATCQGCSEGHLVGWLEGHWHHAMKSTGGRRCDCAEHALWVCPAWHRAFHNRVVKFIQRER